MVKIKVTCNWDSSEKITNRLIEQFVTSDLDLSNICFVHDDSYDINVVFGYITENNNNDKKIFLFPQEPRWSGNHQPCFKGINNITVFGFEKTIYCSDENIIESFSRMFYGSTGDDIVSWNYKNIINNKFKKSKNISSFISTRGINMSEFHELCLYDKRINLLNFLTKNIDFIDYYGGWENKIKKTNLGYPKKFDKIKKYKFSLCIENSNEKYYISEKFYDCILTNTIPIYFGCSNIKEIWGENGYILLDNIVDYNYVAEKLRWINDNSEELYNKMLPDLLSIKEKYFSTNLNPIKKIKELI